MSITYTIVEQDQIEPYVEQLLSLEKDISYPIEGGADHFHIVHGTNYHSFFTTMGKTRFLLIQDNTTLIGSAAATW